MGTHFFVCFYITTGLLRELTMQKILGGFGNRQFDSSVIELDAIIVRKGLQTIIGIKRNEPPDFAVQCRALACIAWHAT